MKTVKILFLASIVLALGAIIYSCQKEEAQTPVAPKGNPMLKADYTAETDCNAVCLQDGPFYQDSMSFIRQWGPLSHCPDTYRNNKWFTTRAWNDLEFFHIRINTYGKQCTQTKVNKDWDCDCPNDVNYPFTAVIITLNGVEYTYSMDDPTTPNIIETAVTFEQSFALPTDWARCDEMVYSVRLEGDGQPVWLGTVSNQESVTYNLIDECNCVTSFTGSTECYAYGETNFILENFEAYGNRHVTFNLITPFTCYAVVSGSLTEVQTLAFPLGLEPNGSGIYTLFEGTLSPCSPEILDIVWTSGSTEPITGLWTMQLFENENSGAPFQTLSINPMNCMEYLPAP